MGNSGSKTQFKHKRIPKRAIIKQSLKAVGIDYIVYFSVGLSLFTSQSRNN